MKILKWESLPKNMRTVEVKEYYNIVYRKRAYLLIKRLTDMIFSCLLIILLLPLFAMVGILIKIDSTGPIMFTQIRVTQYGKLFRIFKFRTMVQRAEKIGSQVTVTNDPRITRIGKVLRKYRIDEIPQLFNIIMGDMTLVGTRPEVPKYVDCYTPTMRATLLLPAGVTSLASIAYKNEEKLLSKTNNPDETYLEVVLPNKMSYNLEAIIKLSLINDIKIIYKTITAVIKRN